MNPFSADVSSRVMPAAPAWPSYLDKSRSVPGFGEEVFSCKAKDACVPLELHAVHNGVMNRWNLADVVSDLARADVLPLPAERISHAVLELDPPRLVLDDEIARALEDVAFGEHVA